MIFTGMLEKAVFYAEYQSIASQGHSGLFNLPMFFIFQWCWGKFMHSFNHCFILNLAVNIYRQCKYPHVHRIMMGVVALPPQLFYMFTNMLFMSISFCGFIFFFNVKLFQFLAHKSWKLKWGFLILFYLVSEHHRTLLMTKCRNRYWIDFFFFFKLILLIAFKE